MSDRLKETLKKFRRGTKPALFLELAKPNEDGFSRKVSVKEFTGKYEELKLGNGGSWCRETSSIGQTFNVIRHKKKGAIESIELQGFNKSQLSTKIPKTIRDYFKDKRCVVLDISKIEIDHKDGRKDDPRLEDPEAVTVDDFQPLSKPVNNAKREHCRKCRETGERYDATKLGFGKSQVQGDKKYRGTCVGCYWYDPKAFISHLSKPE